MQKLLIYFYLKFLKLKFPNLILKKNVYIDLQSKIDIYNNQLILGNNVRIRSNTKGYHAGMPFPCTIFIDVQGAKVKIGDNSRINGVFIHAQKEIIIGQNCVIAAGVNIIDSNGHELKSLDRTHGRDISKSIIIEDNVWIGLNCIILKDTNIGRNSVVAAGSVVKGNFPENSIIEGNPAKIVNEIRY